MRVVKKRRRLKLFTFLLCEAETRKLLTTAQKELKKHNGVDSKYWVLSQEQKSMIKSKRLVRATQRPKKKKYILKFAISGYNIIIITQTILKFKNPLMI